MAERALPQASRKNVLRVFADLLRPDARSDFSTGALTQTGFGQARHAHALLTYLGFLEGHLPTREVQTRRRDLRDFANWLRRAVCESYAPRLGDMAFLFDEPNQEQARSLARQRVDAASRQFAKPLLKRNIAQVVDCLLALREVHRLLQAGRRDWMEKTEPRSESAIVEPPHDAAGADVVAVPFVGNGDTPASNGRGKGRRSRKAAREEAPPSEMPNGNPAPPDAQAADSNDLLSRLAERVSSSSRRIEFHAKHVQIQEGGHTSFTMADVDIKIE